MMRRLAITKAKIWFWTHKVLFLEKVMPKKAISVAERREQWSERCKIRLCREVGIRKDSSGSDLHTHTCVNVTHLAFALSFW